MEARKINDASAVQSINFTVQKCRAYKTMIGEKSPRDSIVKRWLAAGATTTSHT